MRIATPLLLGLVATPAWAQYTRPNVVSSNTATTFQDNIVTPYAEIPVSPLDMIVEAPLLQEYTSVVNGRRGRIELFYYNAATQTHNQVADFPIPVGATSYAVRPGTLEFWVLCPNSRTDTDPAANTSYAGGVVLVVDGITGAPVRTIPVGKGPSGVAFHPSGNVAWVTCRDSRELYEIDAVNGVATSTITLRHHSPHAVDFIASTNEVLVASHLSGNNSASRTDNASQHADVVVDLLTETGITPLPDRDVVALTYNPAAPLGVGSTTLNVGRLATGVMTVQYNLTVDPHAPRAFVVGTEAKNDQFVGEKNFVNGSVVDNLLVELDYSGTGTPVAIPISLDNNMQIGPMGTPTDFVVSPVDATRGWLISRGTDTVVEFDLSTNPVSPVGMIQVQTGGSFSGPLVGARLGKCDATGTQLTVWCEIENSFAVIDVTNPLTLAGGTVTTTPFSYDPMPDIVKRGWGFSSDTRLSSDGSTSCASCHVDGGSDNLVWDLSKWHDPEGTARPLLMHENDNKGPMVTQVLFGLPETGPYHWRGEQQNLEAFNGTFEDLMEGTKLSTTGSNDLEALVSYMKFLRHAPNPNLHISRSYALTQHGPGSPGAGLNAFRNFEVYGAGNPGRCVTCHQLPTGTNNEIQELGNVLGPPATATQVAQLRGVFRRLDDPFVIGGLYGNRARNGAGLTHGGIIASFAEFVDQPAFPGLDSNNPASGNPISDRADLVSFLECFDTGIAPSTQYVRVLDPQSPLAVLEFQDVMSFLSQETAAGNADFTALLSLPDGLGGYIRYPMYFDPSQYAFVFASSAIAVTPVSAMQQFFLGGTAPMSFFGHPAGSGHRWAIDADDDQLQDLDEAYAAAPTNPFLADTDGDGLPDGHEIIHATDPNAPSGQADFTPPSITGYRLQYLTTNTIKFELNTNEPCQVKAALTTIDPLNPTGPAIDLDLVGLSSPASGGFTTNHQIIGGGLMSGFEIPFFPWPGGFALMPVTITVTDPAALTTTMQQLIVTPARVQQHAVRIQSLANGTYVAPTGGGMPSATFEVDLAVGTIGEINLPGIGPIVPGYGVPGNTRWDLSLQISYGTLAPTANQPTNLTKLVGPNPDGTFPVTYEAGLGPVTATVTLPAAAAGHSNRVLLISVDRGVQSTDLNNGPNAPYTFDPSYVYVQPQAYKRHTATLPL